MLDYNRIYDEVITKLNNTTSESLKGEFGFVSDTNKPEIVL